MVRPLNGWFVAALMVSQLMGAGAQAADKCIKPGEVEADKVRYIETQLKVAALQCNDYRHADIPLLYKAFILENRPYLVRAQKPLLSYLKRSEQVSVASYIGGVANRVSVESTRVNQFCSRAMLAAEFSAKAGHPLKLLALMPVPYRQPADFCKKKG